VLGLKTIVCAMVLASGTPRCSPVRSFALPSGRCSALLLTLLSCAVFATAVAAQQSVGEIDAIGVNTDHEGIPARSSINLLSGSSIEAGLQIATFKLKRGGKILVCPGTKLAITTSSDGRGLTFQLDSGNLELDYPLASVADTLVTPKLRLLMSGPGMLHQAVGVSFNGDTCVQSLPANGTWVVVSDGRSDAVYQVPSDAALEFKGGSISGVVPTRRNCGCPSTPPGDVATAVPSEGAGPKQPSPQPQPVIAKEDVPMDKTSASLTDAPPPDSATVAGSLPLKYRGSVSTETQSPPSLTAAATLPQARPLPSRKQLATSPAASQMSGAFTVQVGAFRVKENAYRLADRLKNRHYPVEVLERNDSSHQLWYLVRVGKYANRSLADSVAARLGSEENLGSRLFVCAM
jgi:cell division septation protein DedD